MKTIEDVKELFKVEVSDIVLDIFCRSWNEESVSKEDMKQVLTELKAPEGVICCKGNIYGTICFTRSPKKISPDEYNEWYHNIFCNAGSQQTCNGTYVIK